MNPSTDFTIAFGPDRSIHYQDSSGLLRFFYDADTTTKPVTIFLSPTPKEYFRVITTEIQKARAALALERTKEWLLSRPYLVGIE
jgi:hypothetical protein